MKDDSKRIKVLIVINDLKVAGAQKLVVDLLRKFDRRRFAPELLVLFHFGDRTEYLYHELPKDVPLHQFHFSGMLDLVSWYRALQTLRRLRPDVVLSHLFFSNTLVRVFAPLIGYRVVTVEHNTYVNKPRWHQWVDRMLAPFSTRIVAVSETVASFTARQEGIRPDKFTVIYGAVDVVAFKQHATTIDPLAVRRELGIPANDRVIVNIARIAPQKNHQLLIDGFALFAREHPEYRLVVGGAGSELEAMRKRAKATWCSDRIQFIGWQKDVVPLLVIADFFVLTSFIEGFGSVNLEALSCGVPVLSTKTAGPDIMIKEGVNGFFINDYTPEAVAEAMALMVRTNPNTMREAAKQSADLYSIERAVASYERLFEEVISK